MFDEYKNTIDNFNYFNKLVINMPRHQFCSMNIQFVKELAMILNNIEYEKNEKLTIKRLYYYIDFLILNKPELIISVDDFILKLFNFDIAEKKAIDQYYEQNDGKARDFRHLVEIMRLWGLIDDDKKNANKINYDVCKEFATLKNNEIDGIRSRMLGMDIIDNSFFVSLQNIKSRLKKDNLFSYKPAIYILNYMNDIGRPVSRFEISNLLGIVLPNCNSASEIYENALYIGKQLPENINEHKEWFFKYMNWKNEDGSLFRYADSQGPDFKFKGFILFMDDVGLINKCRDDSYVLSDVSKALLADNIPLEVAELEKYINIAEESYSDRDLADLIIYNIKPSLLKYAAKNDEFIQAMNKRSLAHPKYDNKGKKIRNKLIAELSKVRANYMCQISQKPTFKDSKGNNYVESHHIIEFNGEDGPDIIDNLLVISPFYHSLIHHACVSDLNDFYDTVRKNNIITIDTFKTMIDNYDCLEKKHIVFLLNKHLITKLEYNDLCDYINNR